MATAQPVSREVTAGPCMKDLLLEALGRRFRVKFTFVGLGEREVIIESVARVLDQNSENTRWIVSGYVASPLNRKRFNIQGEYNTQYRTGQFSFTPACILCGHGLDGGGPCQACREANFCSTCGRYTCECGI